MQFSTVTALFFAGIAAAAPQAIPTNLVEVACTAGPVTAYTVVAGDTLTIVSQKHNSGICNIAKANNLANPNFIKVGQVLQVPTRPCTIDNLSCMSNAGANNSCARGIAATYTLVEGDTFFVLAQRLNLSLQALQTANQGVDPFLLKKGQVINIPICSN